MIKGQNGMVIMVIGLVIVLLMSATFGRPELPRTQAVFDKDQSDFSLKVTDTDDRAEVGDKYRITVDITNEESDRGQMYVQCSILDESEHNFLEDVGLQSAVFLSTDENCVENEPFTQTARVTLAGDDSEELTFTVTVPNQAHEDDIFIFCEAFERCGDDPLASDSLKIPITVEEDDGDDSNNNGPGDECVTDSDCSGWFWEDIVCNNGNCEDAADEDTTELSDVLKDATIKDYAKDHQILLWVLGLILFIIGLFAVFNEPKRPSRPKNGGGMSSIFKV